jgi:aminopeptidase N
VASFDGITYPKGASVLKQLAAFLGEDAVVAALRGYFAKHAWQNTTLADLIGEYELASGRDLAGWTKGWLDTAGTDRLVLERDGARPVLRATGPDGGAPRPHRLDVGVYDRDGDGLVRRDLIPLETVGAETDVPGAPEAALLLVNDGDLTFASVRPDASSLPTMLADAGRLPSAVSRAVAVTTAWDMLVWSELSAADFLRCVSGVLTNETVDSVIEPLLALAADAADFWSASARRDELLAQAADQALRLAANPDRQRVALRALAQTAVTDDHFAELRRLAGDDVDLGWRRLVRQAELDAVDPAEVEALVSADPDPDAWVRALAVEAARPDPAAKESAWTAIFSDHKVPMGSLLMVSRAFWRRSQDDLLAGYADRYLQTLPTLHHLGMIPALSVSAALYPRAGVDAAFAERAVAAARADGVSPAVSKTVVELTDRLHRALKTRAI